MGSKNAGKSRKGVLDYAKLYRVKQEPLERVRKEFLITPSCAKQSNNTLKGSFKLHRGEKWQNQAAAKRKQHTQPWLPTTKECNTYTFRKIEQDKLTAQQKKIRNICSKAAHTGSASTEDIITQHPYILTQKTCYRTPQVAKGTPQTLQTFK